MNRLLSLQPVTRRRFLKGLALSMGAGLLSTGRPLPASATADPSWLFSGANYPWISYGLDYAENGWGHSGFITSGWTYQTYYNSQGFTAARVVKDPQRAHTGSGALLISVNLIGKHPNMSKGEVFVDLTQHAPPGVTAPLDATEKTMRCWLRLPTGSAGSPHAPNGVQLFFKSKPVNSDTWYSWYGPWTNIDSSWENNYHQFSVNLGKDPGIADPYFQSDRVVGVGFKLGINDGSTSTLAGEIYLDDLVLETDPPVVFDFEQLELERDMAALACSTSVLRVFVFCDGRAAPDFGADGGVANPGLSSLFFQNFDALLQAAARWGFQIIPVLLDFGWCNLPSTLNGVQLGGHSAIMRTPTLRQSFLQNALRPLIERYGQSTRILAWDIINEPEWAIQELNSDDLVTDKVTLAEMKGFVQACVDLIHSINPASKVTVGSARRKWLANWTGMGLDLYQFHWYDKFSPEEPFPWLPCQDLGLDKPCFIGEVATASTAQTVSEYVQAAQTGGYHGLMVWSFRAGDAFSSYQAVDQSLGRMCVHLPVVRK